MSNDQQADADRTTDLLRRALAEEAAMTEPGPGGLQQIQARTADSDADSRRTRRRWMLVTPLGAGLAAAAVIFGIVLANGGSNNSSEQPPIAGQQGQSGPHDGVYDPSAPAGDQVIVWYVGSNADSSGPAPRLFSETHTVTDPGDDPQLAAVHELLTATPIDPDYRNPWPDGVDVSDISQSNGATTFNLTYSGSDGAFPQSNALRTLAFQMLARSAGLDSGSFGVCLDGSCDDVGHGVLPDDDVRSYISIDNIVDGQTVSNPVTVLISGNTFEGNVSWQLFDSTQKIIKKGFVTTSQGMWTQAPVDLGTLDPGTYELQALETSAEDGSYVINVDNKTFTVE